LKIKGFFKKPKDKSPLLRKTNIFLKRGDCHRLTTAIPIFSTKKQSKGVRHEP